MPIKDPDERKRRQREYSAKYYANKKGSLVRSPPITRYKP
jgi:hypothetical protein